MRFHFSSGFSSIPEMIQIAKTADDVGIDGLSLSDHVFFPTEPATPYPYTADGALPFSLDDSCWPDAWVVMAALGAITKRLRFLTHVYILALRHPVLVAHAGAAAACFAPGRITLGIGVGWQREEFEALGMPFSRRGDRTNESIAILRQLWTTGGMERHDSPHFSIPAMTMTPIPPQPIPILVGGESEAARDRAARLGDGFLSLPHTTEHLLDTVADVRARAADYGRDLETFYVNARCVDASDIHGFHALADAGVDSVNVSLWPLGSVLNEKLDAIRSFSADVVEPFRRRRGIAGPQ